MKPTHIIIHHSGGTDSDSKARTSHHTFGMVDEWHRQKWDFKSALGHYIGYQYFIERDGKVTQGRKDDEEGAHTIGMNKSSIGICLAGNFDVEMPSQAQQNALRALLKEKMTQYTIPAKNIVPHRFYAMKTCYGMNLTDDWARKLVELPTIVLQLIELLRKLGIKV